MLDSKMMFLKLTAISGQDLVDYVSEYLKQYTEGIWCPICASNNISIFGITSNQYSVEFRCNSRIHPKWGKRFIIPQMNELLYLLVKERELEK